MVLMLIATAAVAGVSILYGASVKTAAAVNLVYATRARYLAAAGLAHGLYALQTGATPFPSEAHPNGPFHIDISGDDGYTFYIQATGTPNLYRITATGAEQGITQTVSMTVRATSNYAKMVRDLDPRYWWRLGDTGITAVDEMERKNGTYVNGVSRGAPGVLMGDRDTCADFDGFNDFVNLPEMSKIENDTVTIACWARADGWSTGWPRLIARASDISPNDTFWLLGVHPARKLRFILRTQQIPKDLQCALGPIVVGEWFFAVATYNKNDRLMRVYKDGELVGTMAADGGTNDSDQVGARIGDTPPTPLGDRRNWRGPIDEMFILNEALTEEQIQELYEARIADVEVVSWDD